MRNGKRLLRRFCCALRRKDNLHEVPNESSVNIGIPSDSHDISDLWEHEHNVIEAPLLFLATKETLKTRK